MLWTFEILWIYLLLERSDENMKKKIAIMLTLILATGTFTACTAEEKMEFFITHGFNFRGCFCIWEKF